jgi:uncharacterized small protein (DUF1192 family)
MAITLRKLSAHGPGLAPAEVSFDTTRTLIRGPSDTGKSHIWDCIWYLLGGNSLPEQFPQSSGYDSLQLVFTSGGHEYVVRRGIAGAGAAVFARLEEQVIGDNQPNSLEQVDQDLGELLVKLSGAEGKQLLHNRSKKGAVTGDDVRHWALLSQTGMIAKEPTPGSGPAEPKRISSFSLFLTGTDDSAIEVYKSSSFKDQVTGQLAAAEADLRRTQAGIPEDVDRAATVEALERVEEGLNALTTQHEARSSLLKDLRQQISSESERLSAVSNLLASATSIRERFTLLEQKYSNDIARLGATDEGIAFFEVLPEAPCPLCGTVVAQQADPADLRPRAPTKYREAIAAEVEKIRDLRSGLLQSMGHEDKRIAAATFEVERLSTSLAGLEVEEAQILRTAAQEFNVDPRQLAESHTRLSSSLGAFDEVARLSQEIERLKAARKQKKTPLNRDAGTNGDAVGNYAKEMLVAWGFASIQSVHIDTEACDLVIDGRRRLSYGAGKRGLFRAALTIALMRHALKMGNPHLGTVVLDSPLKAYAHPKTVDNDRDVPTGAVNDNFYGWLVRWRGPGQIVVLENEAVPEATAAVLHPIEFSGNFNEGRQGFYPPKQGVEAVPASPAAEGDENEDLF